MPFSPHNTKLFFLLGLVMARDALAGLNPNPSIAPAVGPPANTLLAPPLSDLNATKPPVNGPPPLVAAPPAAVGAITTTGGHSGCFAYLDHKDRCAYRTMNNNCLPKKTSIRVEQFGGDPPLAAPPAGFPAQGVMLPTTAANLTGLGGANTTGSSAITNSKLKTLRRRAVPPSLPFGPTTLPGSSQAPVIPIKNGPIAPAPPPGNSGGAPHASVGICGTYNPETDPGVCLWDGTDIEGLDPSKSGWLNSALTTNCNKRVVVMRGNTTQTFKLLDGCHFGTLEAARGCSQIYLTKAAFLQLQPTPLELESGSINETLYWDFANDTPPV